VKLLATAIAVSVMTGTLVGCGGSSADPVTRSEALEIIATPPTAPAELSWATDVARQYTAEHLRSELEGDSSRVGDELAGAGFERGYEQTWLLSNHGASAEARVLVFRDAEGAQAGFVPVQRLPRFIPSWFAPNPVDGLGDEAIFGSAEPGAGYLWRRGNVVLSAWMYPFGDSNLDVPTALEAFAHEVDERATERT
jgi:hypothetical protein